MKGTYQFKKTIKAYLDKRAADDNLFAEKYANEKKNIDDCITYILNTVRKTGASGFTDEEVYGMAVHYYDEESIDVGEKIKCEVMVNHHIELTEEDKKVAHQKAMEKFINEKAEEMKRAAKKKREKKPEIEVEQGSLF